MAVILLFLFCICPTFSVIFAIIFYFLPTKKNTLITSIILGFIFAIIAYYLNPPNNYDLYHHQLVVKYFMYHHSIFYLSDYISNMPFESIPIIYSYIISITRNVSLLQFFIVLLGYSILFYILRDSRNKIGLKNIYFIPITCYIIFGFYALYFMSGLYFYIGLILFFLAFYLDYFTKTPKLIIYLIYILTLFIHITMFFPFLLLLILKFFKNKFNYKKIISIILIVFLGIYLIVFLGSNFNIPILKEISHMYNSYTMNNENMKVLYSGIIFFIEISKLIFTVVILYLQHDKYDKKEFSKNILLNYTFILSIASIIIMLSSIVMIRFVMLIQFLAIIPIIDYFKRHDNNIFLYIIMCGLTCIYSAYFIHTMYNQNLGNLNENFMYNIIEIFNKKGE